MWKRLVVLIMVALLPISAAAHTKLFYRRSDRSEYRKVEVMIATSEPMVTAEPTEEPTVTPLVEILLEATLTPESTLALIPTETPTEVPTPTVEIIDLKIPQTR